jgi:hypothetical protein
VAAVDDGSHWGSFPRPKVSVLRWVAIVLPRSVSV